MLLDESHSKPKRHLWLKNVRQNFKSSDKINSDILTKIEEQYQKHGKTLIRIFF